ncbi:MAG: isochorismatase family protein [Pseudomonadota bacterium]
MAGEALLYLSNTSVILVDEPGADAIDRDQLDQALHAGVALSDAGDLPALDLRKDRDAGKPFLADAELMSRITKMGRNGLVICGGLLEGAVTQISLAALMDGMDVFVAADLVVSAEPEKTDLFLARFSACGGHTLSYRQIILELLSAERDDAKRAPLEALLDGR